VQITRQRRNRDVEGRVAREDDDEAEAENAQRPPTSLECLLVGCLLGWLGVDSGDLSRHERLLR
jgi:hypothetical protein